MQNIDDFNARVANLSGVKKGILIGLTIGVLAGAITPIRSPGTIARGFIREVRYAVSMAEDITLSVDR